MTLQRERFDSCLRSPLRRASKTAEIIWGTREFDLVNDDYELREIDLYSFQGLFKAEGKERFGESYRAWKSDPAGFEIDSHYPVRELWDRGMGCWDNVLSQPGNSTLVVAHNAIIQALVASAINLSPE